MDWLGVYLFLILVRISSSLRVSGTWKPSEQSMLVVTKFGIQTIDPLFPQFTRGFIFGNVTNVEKNKPLSKLSSIKFLICLIFR
jgi:hypothetical protein